MPFLRQLLLVFAISLAAAFASQSCHWPRQIITPPMPFRIARLTTRRRHIGLRCAIAIAYFASFAD